MKTLALIGAGAWGRNIVSTLSAFKDVKLKYLCARSQESLAAFSDIYEKLSDWKELLYKDDIDAVLIATPVSSHAEIAIAFLKKGIPVFVEKPMAESVSDAQAMEKAARAGKTNLFVGHIHLYNPAYQATKEAVKSLGDISFINCEAGKRAAVKESALWDWGTHDVALTLDLIGARPSHVSAWGVATTYPKTDLYDTAFLKLRFKNGAQAAIRASWLEPLKKKKLTIFTGKDAVVFDDALPEGKVSLLKGFLDEKNAPVPELVSYASDKPLEREMRAFIECVRTGKKPLTDAAHGVEVVKILVAAEKSIKRGGKEVAL